eukprot:TRINITY_DN7962_c0_g2_i1.p1 TRINITY_DN7962_c0_g2~~TRINITY_DN7962_c0_g2_i1.p1  ORF type:complete len:780 (-),score=167.99 TRINITY_DN7962_c0_g2_i1:151-2490(-)
MEDKNNCGFWEGRVFKLRDFFCLPSKGSSKNVDYHQNMGKITLTHAFRGQLAELREQDLNVELSSSELKVKASSRAELDNDLAPLCGHFHADVRRELSWWALDAQADGSKLFTIELAKREHKAWNAIWKQGLSHHRKNHFGWTPATKTPVRKAEDMLVKMKSGRLPLAEKDTFVIRREDLCVALEDGQDDATVIYRIHLDKDALHKACESVCLSNLFGVDVMQQHLKVFIRGDEQSPILMGQLCRPVVPDRTRWEIVKAQAPAEVDGEEDAQPPAKQKLGQYNSCLQISLVKAKSSSRHWPFILEENETALQREAAPKIEDLQTRAIREPSPDRSGWSPHDIAKEAKTKGDSCFKNSAWRDAVVYYTRAISNVPNDEKLYSNRSACYMKLKKFDKALADAKKCEVLNSSWPKTYFRQGQAFRGLRQWEEAINAFKDGRFREPMNKEWDREIEKTEDERGKFDAHLREQRRLRREADMVTELNEATLVAEREAMVAVAEQALKAGKSRKEAGELALKGAELAKQRVHEMANQKRKAMMVENDEQLEEAAPYRIVQEDGGMHSKGFAHTDKGLYFMGMTLMNSKSAPRDQPWIEIRHPGKLRWSQGCAILKMKVALPESVRSAADVEVSVTPTTLRIGTVGDSDAVVEGEFSRKVEPQGENFCWYLIPDEEPPMLELALDKDNAEVYQTYTYGSLLWTRLFNDDLELGEGLFEADLTDLPEELLNKFITDQARADEESRKEREKRAMMTEEEIAEETGRMWNEEFARHGMPYRVDTNEDRR